MSKAGKSILRGAHQALAHAQGEENGAVAHVPEQIDVKAIRRKVGMSQAKFASHFGFGVDAIKNWEQGRRHPDVSTRAFLTVIDREPEAVRRALSQPFEKKSASRTKKVVARNAVA